MEKNTTKSTKSRVLCKYIGLPIQFAKNIHTHLRMITPISGWSPQWVQSGDYRYVFVIDEIKGFFRFLSRVGSVVYKHPIGSIYTVYIPGIYCLLRGYKIPTAYHQNQNNPLMRHLFSWFSLYVDPLWSADRGGKNHTHSGSLSLVTSYKLGYTYPKAYMYGIYTYIYHKIQPKVGKYTIHGWYGLQLSPLNP